MDVIDQGIGIAEEDKVNVFVPNFTTKSTGSGLGLAIARQIIENVEEALVCLKKKEEYILLFGPCKMCGFAIIE